jgi:hypothetical protein
MRCIYASGTTFHADLLKSLQVGNRSARKATERAIERTTITKQRVAEELAKIGLAKTGLGGDDEFLDLSELTREQAAMLQVKHGALMDIAKLFGYVTDKSEVKHIDEFERMDADELRAHIAKIGLELGIPVKPLTTETSARLRGCNGSVPAGKRTMHE